jgi:GNAT superfamily N-acetyltransferase
MNIAAQANTSPMIVIREAHGEEDIAAARRLMREYGDHLANNPSGAANICLTGYERELEQLPEGYATILLAEVDGAPAGCVALREIKRPERACEMKRLWVGSGFRRLRLGRLLVEEALNWAEREGFEAMYLDTVPAAMPEANRLYASFGFKPVERYNRNDVAGVEFFSRPIKSVR